MPTHKFIRTDDEIDRVLNWAVAQVKEDSRQPGDSYEDGVIIMLNWLTGKFNVAPDEGTAPAHTGVDPSMLKRAPALRHVGVS